MKVVMGILLGVLAVAITASAQAAGSAEQNLKQKNITLPRRPRLLRTMSLRYVWVTFSLFRGMALGFLLSEGRSVKTFRLIRATKPPAPQGCNSSPPREPPWEASTE